MYIYIYIYVSLSRSHPLMIASGYWHMPHARAAAQRMQTLQRTAVVSSGCDWHLEAMQSTIGTNMQQAVGAAALSQARLPSDTAGYNPGASREQSWLVILGSGFVEQLSVLLWYPYTRADPKQSTASCGVQASQVARWQALRKSRITVSICAKDLYPRKLSGPRDPLKEYKTVPRRKLSLLSSGVHSITKIIIFHQHAAGPMFSRLMECVCHRVSRLRWCL